MGQLRTRLQNTSGLFPDRLKPDHAEWSCGAPSDRHNPLDTAVPRVRLCHAGPGRTPNYASDQGEPWSEVSEWWWCLQKPTAADSRPADPPGRTQAGPSDVPRRGSRGGGSVSGGRGWAGPDGREGLRRHGCLRLPLVPSDGRQDHVEDDPTGPSSALPAVGPNRPGSVPSWWIRSQGRLSGLVTSRDKEHRGHVYQSVAG